MTAISIIIPVFNAVDHLASCVESIASQSFDDYEVIIIDDGSYDGTERLCDQLAEGDGRIRAFHMANAGASSARNAGVGFAKGEYVWFVDADDRIADGALGKIIGSARATNADCVLFDSIRFYEDGREVLAPLFSEAFDSKDPSVIADIHRFFLYPRSSRFYTRKISTGYVAPWSKVFRTELVRSQGVPFDPDLVVYEDGMFTLKAFDDVASIAYIAEPLYHYRFLQDSLIHAYREHLPEERLAAFQAIESWLRRTGKDESFWAAYHCHVVSYVGGLLSRYYFHPEHRRSGRRAGKEIKELLSKDSIHLSFKEVDFSWLKNKDRALAVSGRMRNVLGMRLYYIAKRCSRR